MRCQIIYQFNKNTDIVRDKTFPDSNLGRWYESNVMGNQPLLLIWGLVGDVFKAHPVFPMKEDFGFVGLLPAEDHLDDQG